MAKGDPKARGVGFVVRMWRDIRGLTQVELQERARLPKGKVSKIENGEQSPTLEDLRALAQVLDVSVEGLVALSERTDASVIRELDAALAARRDGALSPASVLPAIEALLKGAGLLPGS
jgi:transcriptional regulator with XRE-family HTH domain